ncbi:MAG: hypothetical protein VX621_03170 [Candidatus Thermoplasmatota archaeon]|nr:hypothetical protein [Candidatus Thermoplasmatota archaeon]
MEETLRDLLSILRVNLHDPPEQNDVNGFTILGMADSLPDLLRNTVTGPIIIWHAPAGLLPITDSEITRFTINAPEGFHWILSQRDLQSGYEIDESLKIDFWSPEKIAKWIGESVISGDLYARLAPKKENEKTIGKNEINSPQTKTLRPQVDISSWMSQRGLSGLGSTPILLDAKLWFIEGEITGPNGESEKCSWNITEDPWSNKISEIDNIEDLQDSLRLRIISPEESGWLSADSLKESVGSLLNVRRKSEMQDENQSGSIRSMLLQRWSFNKDSAIMTERKILVPGWIIHFEEEKALHGLNGRLYSF